MIDYNELISDIESKIRTNDAQLITGSILLGVLKNIANTIGDDVISVSEKVNSFPLIDMTAYGIEWDITQSTPDCVRIGNPLLHKSLPIQNSLRGCVVKNGVVNYYLYSEDWAYKEDGVTPSVLDGTDGTVEVDTGMEFYGKSFEVGNKRRVYISTTKIDDTWVTIPRMFVSAYRLTVDTTDSTKPKAVSVVNTSALFRGGGNRTAYDEYLDTNLFRTDLGKPRTVINRANMRNYAKNADSSLMCYELYKWILYWLPIIEYATFNMLKSFNAELTSDGYHQGGLGSGVTTINGANWNKFNDYCPLTPCGYANTLGNHTGVVSYTIPAATATDDTEIPEVTFSIARWRGIENIFGDIWTNLDGIILINDVDSDDGNGVYTRKKVYTLKDPSILHSIEDLSSLNLDTLIVNNELNTNFELVGYEYNSDGYIKEFNLGDEANIIPSDVDGGSTTYKCDCHYVGNKTNLVTRTLAVGGLASTGGNSGPGSFYSKDGVAVSSASIGFRSVKPFNN